LGEHLEMQQPFWGRGAEEWAEIQEPQQLPLYEAILRTLKLPTGSAILDGGCGSGMLTRLASEQGLTVTGLDASPMFIDVARRRSPATTFTVGDLEHLPFEDATFDAVVGCNSFQFVSPPAAAAREAARVLRNGGQLAIAVFDAPAKCDGAAPIAAILSLLPAPSPSVPGPFALSSPEMLTALVDEAGFIPEPDGVHAVSTPWIYRDRDVALRAFMSSGPGQHARSIAGEARVRAALDSALAPYRRSDGTYLLENFFMFIVGRKA
jgi:SAM-dependent methyltransferase